jgi:hypothetical protein
MAPRSRWGGGDLSHARMPASVLGQLQRHGATESGGPARPPAWSPPLVLGVLCGVEGVGM